MPPTPPTLAAFLLKISAFQLFSLSAFSSPPPPVHTPDQQLATFQFAEPGYRIELVAADPMVQDPVATAFDGSGRLWVVEMRGFMQDIDRTGADDPVGRISVLEDTDADGRMDKSTVFLDGLVLPRAINLQPDGVLVAENRKLWFARDTDGDLVCDSKNLVDPDYARDNVEHSANGLCRALDNWIYNAKEGHRYRRQRDTWARDEIEDRGQWGICQDDLGRLFYNYNHSQLHTDLAPPGTLTRNPSHTPTIGTADGVTTTNDVHPIRPTPAANRAYIPGALDDHGRIKQFTSACAPLVYRASLMPELRGDAFVCETVGNLIKRNTLTNDGTRVTGQPAYPDRDFLASTDERFRPVFLAHGPDGAIYITDMYRGIVQDGPHMSPYLRDHLIARKMDSPVHLGRIWRIVPDKPTKPNPKPDFSNLSADALVDTLAHPDGWWRDTAQSYLVDTPRHDAIPALRKVALEHDDELARLHALWTLEGLRAPEPHLLLPALTDPSDKVRTAAVHVLASLGTDPETIFEQLGESPLDPVALAAILVTTDPDHVATLALPRLADPLFRDAALSSLAKKEAAFLYRLWPQLDSTTPDPGAAALVESLTAAVLRSRTAPDIATILTKLQNPSQDWRQSAILAGVQSLAPVLTSNPVTLKTIPHPDAIPRIRPYFAWPGHTPEPPAATAARPLNKSEQRRFARGRQVYLTNCAACHGTDGKGMNLLAPPLAGSDWVHGSPQRLARVLLHGLSGPITVSGKRYQAPDIQPLMPPLASMQTVDIAAVMTYIRRAWGNTAEPVPTGTVNKVRIASQGRTLPWTEEELEPYADTRPNVLLIVADDLGYSDLGCYGGEIATPNLDALAAGGVRLTQFYNTGRCCPSRASLLTGHYPHAVGLGHMTKDINRRGYSGSINPDAKTIAQHLTPLGYRSFIAGKWHLGTDDPTRHGFEQFYGTLVSAKRFFDPAHMLRKPDNARTISYPEGEFYATDAVTDHALQFLAQARPPQPAKPQDPTKDKGLETKDKNPWFLYLAYHAPHFPLHAPPGEIAKYADRYHGGWDKLRTERLARMKQLGIVPDETTLPPRSHYWNYGETKNGTNPAWDTLPDDRRLDLARRMAIYAAMVDRMDQQIGRVIDDLRANDELDRTLIVFLSDNGACAEWDPFGFDGKSSNHNVLHTGAALDTMGAPGTFHSAGSGWANASNTPWRLYKHFNHEGGINSPCIVHWPAGLAAPSGSLHHHPAHLIDLVPTALTAAGADPPDDLPGTDLAARIAKTTPPKRELFFEHEGNRGVRTSKWKLVALRGQPWELYDFRLTRTETKNLADQHPEVVEYWAKQWDKWAEQNHVTPLPDDYGVQYLRKN